jgi:D-sedoheptulose 7-phosphate isomerase
VITGAREIVDTTADEHAALAASIREALEERRAAIDRGLVQLGSSEGVVELAEAVVRTLRRGGRVLAAGNGGSAAEAQHFAAELVGRFTCERRPYPVLALTADSAALTAIADDYGYADVFVRQVEAHGTPGDLLVLFSTCGRSPNVLRAVDGARRRAMTIAAVTGERRSDLARVADIVVHSASSNTAVTQELHAIVTHVVCAAAERALAEEAS